MRVFDKDWTAVKINETTFELRCGKEKVTVHKSPANDGSWFPAKGRWAALTFHLAGDGLVLGRPKK